MRAIIFSEGNGYGHAARDRLLSEHFSIPIMTFGKGAEYCRKNGMMLIEIPSPYSIQSAPERVKLASDVKEILGFMKPDVLATIMGHFRKVDVIFVDGTPLGLAIALLARKKAVYIANDTSALVGVHGAIERKIASSLLNRLLGSAGAIIVPDFPPPLCITMANLNLSLPLTFAGPLSKPKKQLRHGKRILVSGYLEKELRPLLGADAMYGGDMPSAYGNCDLVICHGGHTTIMEALSHGKPVLCITDKTHLERHNNALSLESHGVGVLLESKFLGKESLEAAIGYARTLDKNKLKFYKEFSNNLEPMRKIEEVLSAI